MEIVNKKIYGLTFAEIEENAYIPNVGFNQVLNVIDYILTNVNKEFAEEPPILSTELTNILKENKKTIDCLLWSKYSELELIPFKSVFFADTNTFSFTLSFNAIMRNVCHYLNSNDYKYVGLYNTTKCEYNPIENYSMTETEKIIDNKTFVQGGQSNSSNNTLGSQVNNITNNSEVAPFDTTSFQPQNKDTTLENIGQKINNTTDIIGNRVDNDDKNVDRNLTRKGNIGVTTSQQMIESERKLVNFNLCELIVNDISNILFIKTY